MTCISSPRPSTAAWCQSPCERSLPGPEPSSGSAAPSWTAGGAGGCGWQTAWPGSTSSRTAPRCWPCTQPGVRGRRETGKVRTASGGGAPSPLSLLHQRHQQLHRVVGQLGLRAPHRQVVDHLLQQVAHDPLGALRVGAERRAERDADLKMGGRGRGLVDRLVWGAEQDKKHTCSYNFSSTSRYVLAHRRRNHTMSFPICGLSSCVRLALVARDSTSDVRSTADNNLEITQHTDITRSTFHYNDIIN